jgi:hypothetical protein
VRQVGQSALDDLGAFAVALAKQNGGRRVAVRDRLDVHVLHGRKRREYIKYRFVTYMGTDRHKFGLGSATARRGYLRSTSGSRGRAATVFRTHDSSIGASGATSICRYQAPACIGVRRREVPRPISWRGARRRGVPSHPKSSPFTTPARSRPPTFLRSHMAVASNGNAIFGSSRSTRGYRDVHFPTVTLD